MAHNLLLHIEDDSRDCKYILATDFSEYDPQLPLAKPTLMVQTPGFLQPVEVLFSVNGKSLLNSGKLGLTKPGAPLAGLPDGLYTFTYSIAPHQKVRTLVYHFRVMNLEARIAQSMLTSINHRHDLVSHLDGLNQQQKEEKMLIRAMNLLKAIQLRKIDTDDTYNLLLGQYKEVERIVKYVNDHHV